MLFTKYRFVCRLEGEAFLPYYKGSTFRSVFGRSLKKVVCALKRQDCPECMLKERCIYTRVFETSIAVPSPTGSRMASPPHPFVIEPPLTTETHFMPGTPFDFHLLLFGEVNSSLPYFIFAFDQMGRTGIGKRINGKRARFVLERVEAGEDTVYSSQDQKIRVSQSPEDLLLETAETDLQAAGRVTLVLQTPLRLKFENRLTADLPFHVLVRAMLRRVSSLMNCYGQGEPDLDYRGLVEKAKQVKVVESDLHWFDWRRYSFRQDRAMLMGGMVGSITYEGRLGAYLPLIEFSGKVHMGKQTTFDLGKIERVFTRVRNR